MTNIPVLLGSFTTRGAIIWFHAPVRYSGIMGKIGAYLTTTTHNIKHLTWDLHVLNVYCMEHYYINIHYYDWNGHDVSNNSSKFSQIALDWWLISQWIKIYFNPYELLIVILEGTKFTNNSCETNCNSITYHFHHELADTDIMVAFSWNTISCYGYYGSFPMKWFISSEYLTQNFKI